MSARTRQRTLIEKLGSVLVAFQIVSVFCAGLALFGLKALPAPVALGGTAVYILLLVLAVPLLRKPWGKWYLLALEIVLTLLGFVHGSMWIVGGLFLLLWGWCLKTNAEHEQRMAAYEATAANLANDSEA